MMRLHLSLSMLLLLGISAAGQETFHFTRVPEDSVWSRLEQFGGKNVDREMELKKLFTEAGCGQDHLSELAVSHAKTPDVLCVLPGETDREIVVGAHYDKVDAGQGVVDNWSGASMLPSLLQAIAGTPRHHTYVFIGFTDEEKGLVGSAYFVKHLGKEERQKISGMVNLDTLGLGPTEVWTSHADKVLLEPLAVVAAAMKLPISTMNVDGAGSSDSESFREKNIPALTLHSITRQTFPILHTPKDTIQSIQRKEYLDSFRLISGYLAYLDMVMDKAPQSTGTTK